MPTLPNSGALCAPVAGLRTGFLRGCWRPHPHLRALWPCVLRENGPVLGRDAAAPWNPRLPPCLPLLLCPAVGQPWIHPAHISRSHRLMRWPQKDRKECFGDQCLLQECVHNVDRHAVLYMQICHRFLTVCTHLTTYVYSTFEYSPELAW